MRKQNKLGLVNSLLATALGGALAFPLTNIVKQEISPESIQTTQPESIQTTQPESIQTTQPESIQTTRPIEQINTKSEIENDLIDSFIRYEGYREKAYLDTKGNVTIGVGFNLERKDAKQRITSIGLDFKEVYEGRKTLTRPQVISILTEDIAQARLDAKKYLKTKEYQELKPEAQNIVTDMAFNLGYTRLSKFKNLRKALINENYCAAADEMVNSKWYREVGRRSKELVKKMRTLGDCE